MKKLFGILGVFAMLFFGCSQELVVDPPDLPDPRLYKMVGEGWETILEYDDNGRLDRVISITGNRVSYTQTTNYSTKGRLISETRVYSDGREDAVKYEYAGDRITGITETVTSFNGGTEFEYSFNYSNLVFKEGNIISYDRLSTEVNHRETVEYEYQDGDVTVVKVYEYDTDGKKHLSRSEHHEYNDVSNPFKNEPHYLLSELNPFYMSDHHIVKSQYKIDGKIQYEYHTTYTYAKGLPVSSDYQWIEGNEVFHGTTTYIYE